MNINVIFNGIEEMQQFAEYISGKKTAEAANSGESIKAAVPSERAVVPEPRVSAPVQAMAVPPAQAAAVPPAQAVTVVPTTQTSYQQDDLAKAAVALMDAGRQDELVQVLGRFGVRALPDLRPEQYGAFATALREMGAKI